MNYCALDDAFQAIGGAPSPGCSMDAASKAARKEERRKARRCKGPAATYLDLDPDRPSDQNVPSFPVMNSAIGMTEHVPVTAQYGSSEPFKNKKPHFDQNTPNFDKDPLYDYVQSDIEEHVMKVSTSNTNAPPARKSYFGASMEDGDDGFADYIPDEKVEPTDFRKAFDHMGVGRAGSTASLPNAAANMYWKPLTRTGAQTAFVEHLPPNALHNSNAYTSHTPYQRDHGSMSDVMKKIDKLFARLDDMNSSTSPEQATSEIMMFVSSGIFVLFLMDLMVKKGSTMRF
jgi:hypothetical protein